MLTGKSVAQVAIDIVMGKNTVKDVVKNSLSEVNRVVSDSASTTQQKMNAVGTAMTSVGASLLPVSTAVAGVGIAAGRSAIGFENSMAKVQTIAGKTDAVYKGHTQSMSKAIMGLSNDTGIAAGEVADATYQAISAGVDTSESVEFVSRANALAVGGFTDMTTSVDVLTTAINAYGLRSGDASMVSDRLVTTQNLGKTTVDELAGSIGRVIPTASAYGVSIDNLCASYVEMTKGGIATAEATTYTKSMLNELGDSGSKVGKVLQEQTGKGFTELMQSGASLGDVMGILGKSVDGNSTAFAQLWGSQEAGTGALAILNAGCVDFNGVLGKMADSTGAAKTAMDAMNDTTGHEFQVTMNNMKNAGMELGKSLLTTFGPVITAACKAISALCGWFQKLPGPVKSVVSAILVLVAAAGPLLIVAGKVATSVAALAPAFAKVGPMAVKAAGVIKPALTGIGGAVKGLFTLIASNPVILAIAGIIAAVVFLYNKCAWFRDAVNAVWDAIKTGFHAAWDGIVSFFTTTIPGAWNSVVQFFSGIPAWWSGLWQGVSSFFSGIWTAILNNPVVQSVVNTVTSVWNIGKDTLTGIWDGIHSAASSAWELIKNTILAPVLLLADLVTGNFGKLSSDAQNIWSNMKNAASSIWSGMKQGAVSIAAGMSAGAKAAFQGLKDTASSIWQGLKSTTANAWDTMRTGAVSAAGRMRAGAVSAFHSMHSAIGSTVGNIRSAVVDGFERAVSYITSLPGRAFSWGADIINGIVSGIRNCIGSIASAASSVASTIRSYLHFSVPDVGPLTDYESWMPDFMGGLARGIDTNRGTVAGSVRALAETMRVTPALIRDAPGLRNASPLPQRQMDSAAGGSSAYGLEKVLEKYLSKMETAGTGDITIPVYIGNDLIENLVVKAKDRLNLRSGGRTG